MKHKKFYISFLFVILLSVFFYWNNVHELSVKEGNLKIHIINAGQSDAILIQGSQTNVMLDSGTIAAEKDVVKYLKSHHIKNIQYAIATHPHEDHIGNFATVFDKFRVDQFYLSDAVSTTSIYKQMLQSALNNNVLYADYKTNGTFSFDGAEFEILYTDLTGNFDNMNNNSLLLKVTHKNNTFLFCGDAERDAEDAFLRKYGEYLQSDVIKIAHHGSKTSSMPEFLDIVDPKYALITCGVDKALPNAYTLQKLKDRSIEIYRTDYDGNIVILSDGDTLTFQTHVKE